MHSLSSYATTLLARSAAAIGTRGFGVGLTLLVQILAGVLFGVSGVESAVLVLAWSRIGSNLLGFGYPQLVLRDVSQSNASTGWVRQRGADLLGVGLVVFIVAGIVSCFIELRWATILLSSVAGSVAIAYTRIGAEAHKAKGRPQIALCLEYVIPPFVTLFAFFIAWSNCPLSPSPAIAVALGFVASAFFARVPDLDGERYESFRSALRRARPFWLSGSMTVVYGFLPVAVAPLAHSGEWTATVGAAARLVALPAVVLVALGAVLSPALGGNDARRSLLSSCGIASAITIPVCLILLVFADDAIRISSGGVLSDPLPLRVLALGQIVNALTGLGTETLQMRGHERLESALAAFALAIGGFALCVLYATGFTYAALIAFTVVFANKQLVSFAFALRATR